ncbi:MULTISPECIES: ABC transporter ATP-binding protein/permease [Clostridium]|uniref:ABC transporter ATP-binding protein/permease n=1 Tax=Clostridium sp. TaxID=1506 RepID=UPI00291532D9|nr:MULTISPECIES: ABC transporter ATP-binding protein/permease [Clostridium]MDU4847989.1 ABC transporter ATP-binding protein/permease [Clostridium sp.]
MMINKRLIGICKDSKKYMILTVIANMISIICNILIVILIGGFINSLYLGEKFANDLTIIKAMKDFKITDNISLFNGVICIAILLIIRYSSNILYGKFSHLASANARVTLRELIYKKLLRLGPGYSNVESTAAVVQMSIEGVEQLEIYFGKYLPQFFYSMLAPITLFIFISFISLKAALVFIVCVPLIPLSIIAIMKIAKRILKAYWKNYSNLGGRFLENLQGLTTLKVFNLDKEKHEQMNSEAERFRRITMKVLSMQLNSINIMDFIAFGGAALGTIVALNQFRNGQLLAGDLLIIILLSSEFFIPLRLLGSYFHIAMNGMTASDRIFELLDSEEKEKNTKEITNELDDVSIEFEDVTFSYDGKRRVLNNINLEVNKGQLVAIVGESGSGKSTIASLILNSYSATSGKIKVNDINIENISSDDLYKKISLVSTNSYIFNGTILDNLLMGNRNAKDEEIDDALKKSRLDEFINSLKDGVNTNVGEGGNSLSGGQKQRLSLARAILADREMIIFDEATSNIDVESEEAIWKAIYELAVNKTILVISHRLANVTKADSIYVMKNGYLVEHGNHEELLNLKGEYLNMINKQNELENIRKGC